MQHTESANTSHNKPMLFSVLIASYNNGIYIEDAINSIYNQTYTNWEIIIVDDCSTDISHEVYKQYQDDPRIHIYYNKKNCGCGYTKRRCAELANGEICGFLDPDDTLEPSALEVMVKAHEEDESLSLVYSRHNEVDQDLQYLYTSGIQKAIPVGSTFLINGGISHFVSFKKSAYNKTIGIGSEFLRAVDHDLYFKLEEVGNIKFIDAVLYNYRRNTGNNISLGDNAEKAYLWHIVGIIDACRRRGLPLEDIIYNDFRKWCSNNYNPSIERGRKEIINSRPYQLGYCLLYPFILARKVFHKIGK